MEKVKETFCFKVKNELKHAHLLGFFGLRSKIYSCLLEISSTNFGKGVLNTMDFHAYYKSLVSQMSFSAQFSKISSINHILSLKEEVRSCFNYSDDKRYYVQCLVHSRPIRHYLNCIRDKCDIFNQV